MNKKDLRTLVVCNLVTVLLLIEHLSGLQLAMECMCVWTIISTLIHIHILKDYVRIYTFVDES